MFYRSIFVFGVSSVIALVFAGCGSEDPLAGSNDQPDGKNFPFSEVDAAISEFTPLDYAEFRKVGLSAVPPKEFERSKKFHGFSAEKPEASVTFTTSPVSFKNSIRPYVANLALKHPDSVFLKKLIGPYQGFFLYYDEEKQGRKVGTQYLVFGDDAMSWILSASYIDEDTDRTVQIAKTLMSVRTLDEVDRNTIGGDASFRLDSSLLKPTMGWTKTLVLTQEGTFPLANKDDPFVKATETFQMTPATRESRIAFARKHLLPSEHVKIDNVFYEKPIMVGDVKGIEIAANAFDHSTKTPILLHFAVLFEEDSQVVIHAWAGRTEKEKWLSEFEAITRSYSR